MLKINSHSLDVPPKELPTYVLRLEVQRVIEQYAKVFQCPKDFITSAVYCIVATLCGKHVTIHDGKYRNHPNLWISHIAPSGSNKSSPIKTLLEPMHQEDGNRYRDFRDKYKVFKKNVEEDEPVFNQLIVSDVTPEGLYQVLDRRCDSSDGLLLYRDEIKGFIDDIGRYHNSGEISNYLSIWDGTTFSVTRKTQMPIRIEHPFLCMMGGIQPDAFTEAFKRNLASLGFVQRWLFVYPDNIPKSFYSEVVLESSYVEAWNEIFTKLLKMGNMELTLSAEAKQVYIDYYNETKARTDENDSFQASMLSKLRIHVLKWCAITHILSCQDDAGPGCYFALPSSTEVSAEEMKYSVECMRYFEYCGTKALNLITGGTTARKMTKEQLIKQLYSLVGEGKMNITKFAEGIGVSRQYVSRIVNKQPELHGCGCASTETPLYKGSSSVILPQPAVAE